jgi:hypothetical protein
MSIRTRRSSSIYLIAIWLVLSGEAHDALALKFRDLDGAFGRSLLNLLHRDSLGSEGGRPARGSILV